MSTATLERVAVEREVEWGPWSAYENGIGERRYSVSRHQVNWEGQRAALGEWHVSAKGAVTKYTLAGAEKKAHELNREVADAKRRDAFLAKVAADRLEQQTVAQEVREVAQCGTLNSEMIARWIIGNYTHNDEAAELREIAQDAQISAKNERDSADDAENRLAKVQERCNSLATEAHILLAELGAFGPPVFTDPLAYAIGNTPLEKVIDMSRNLIAALTAYEQES